MFYYLNMNTGKGHACQSSCLVISFPCVPCMTKLKFLCIHSLVLDVIGHSSKNYRSWWVLKCHCMDGFGPEFSCLPGWMKMELSGCSILIFSPSQVQQMFGQKCDQQWLDLAAALFTPWNSRSVLWTQTITFRISSITISFKKCWLKVKS